MKHLALAIQGRADFADLPATSTLRRWISHALERDAVLTLRFVNVAEGRRLNREFRRKDQATNVLTFDYAQRPRVLADIVLCVPVIRREARDQRKAFRHHLAHLVTHGVLHAQGREHDTPRAAQRMEAREIALLKRWRIPNPYE